MVIKANSEELWDFIVFLNHTKEDMLQEIDVKKKKLVFCQSRLTENQNLIVEKINRLNKLEREFEVDSPEMEKLRREFREISNNLSEVEGYTTGDILENRKQSLRDAFKIVTRNIDKYMNYLESLEMDSAYATYCAESGAPNGLPYKKVTFRGTEFWIHEDNFDYDTKDSKGRTNLERMLKGYSPIGKDGMYINLHHMEQSEDGGIIEIKNSTHKENHKILHINPSSIPSGINRQSFNKLRSAYWKRRAQFEIRRRSEL